MGSSSFDVIEGTMVMDDCFRHEMRVSQRTSQGLICIFIELSKGGGRGGYGCLHFASVLAFVGGWGQVFFFFLSKASWAWSLIGGHHPLP